MSAVAHHTVGLSWPIRLQYSLTAAGIMMGIRFLIWGFVKNPVVLLASQLLLDYCLAVYINDKMPAELKATSQAFKTVVGFTLPLAIGSLIAGVLSDLLGIQAVFRIGAAWLFAVVFARIGRRTRRLRATSSREGGGPWLQRCDLTQMQQAVQAPGAPRPLPGASQLIP